MGFRLGGLPCKWGQFIPYQEEPWLLVASHTPSSPCAVHDLHGHWQGTDFFGLQLL